MRNEDFAVITPYDVFLPTVVGVPKDIDLKAMTGDAEET